ncbi:hypothetical protein OROHE_011679 [Orobanche hederae]
MPLDIPLSLVSMISRPFVIPYNQSATVFLIGCRRHLNHGAILFDTTDMSFKEFNTMPLIYSCHPITVVVDRTMYWIDGEYLEAYDFDNHFGYSALTSDSVLSDFGHRFTNKNWGPLLVHLDKNLFCFFTMYCYQDSDDSALHRVVECTKFRATKVIDDMSCKHGHLDLELVGYQSYQCDSLLALHGVLPMYARLGGSKKQHREGTRGGSHRVLDGAQAPSEKININTYNKYCITIIVVVLAVGIIT